MYDNVPGRVTIAPEVLVTIAKLTTLSVPGVVRMVPTGIQGFMRRGATEGVLLEVNEECVHLDLFIAADANANLRQVGQKIQVEIARAIRDMVGMGVETINVHIQDVVYPELAAQVTRSP